MTARAGPLASQPLDGYNHAMPDSILDQLTRTATEHGRTALWLEALPWIVDTCDAIGGQIVIDLAAPARRSCGCIEPALQPVIDGWEAELSVLEYWLPTGRASLTGTPATQVVARDDLPIVHFVIYEGRSVAGGLSLVYEAGALPGSNLVDTASALIQSLTRMATLAHERYQLQRRLTQGNLLYEVSRAISSSLEIDDVLGFTTALATNALGAEASALLLVDQKAGELVFAIVDGAIAASLQGQRRALADVIVTRVLRTGQPLIVNDVQHQAVLEPLREVFSPLVVRNVLCAPLQARGEVLGVLQVLNREGSAGFSAEDMEWLMALAGQASVAIENARLYSTLREERDRIVQAEEEVRHNLARNLHDSAAQLLGSLVMNIEVARKIAQTQPHALDHEFDMLRELAQQASQEMRQALLELRPVLVETRGLLGALQGYVNQQRRRGFAIEMRVSGELPEILNKQVEVALYLIVQEALTNVRKHANAQHTRLRIAIEPLSMVIEVEDDGIGLAALDKASRQAERGGMGLLSMRERVQWLEGALDIITPCNEDGKGTRVRIEVPLARLTTLPNADAASWIIATQKSR